MKELNKIEVADVNGGFFMGGFAMGLAVGFLLGSMSAH